MGAVGPDTDRTTIDDRCRVAREALICRHADTATLLSTRTWRYFGLNATATRLWLLLADGVTPEDAAVAVAHDTGTAPATVLHDVRALVAELRRRGLLAGGDAGRPVRRGWVLEPPRPASADVVPSLRACAAALLWAGVGLKRRPLDPDSWLRPGPGSSGRALTPADRRAVTRQLRRAAAWLPAQTHCLQQSLALTMLLRRAGVAACLRLGARPFPFVAHAWVEAGGQPVNEAEEQLAMYSAFTPASRTV